METSSPPETALPAQAGRPPATPPPDVGGADLDVAPPPPPTPAELAPGAAEGLAQLRKRPRVRPDGAGGAGLALAPGAGIATPGGAHRMPGLLRSAGFRFAVLFAVLFATAALVLVGTLWLVTAGTLDRQTDSAIRADALALVERFRDGGTTSLVEAIEERLAVDIENDSIYLLVTADTDRRLAGNLNRWPVAWHPTENWFRTRVVHDGAETEARLYKVELPELRLLIGRDDTERRRLQQLLTEGVLSTSSIAVFL